MVVDVGAIKAGLWRVTEKEILAVRAATDGVLLKVILETAALTDDEIVRACIVCKEAGADFVKTSTGFGDGGATPEVIGVMVQTVGQTMGVKASGGVRSYATAAAYLDQSCTRLGATATKAIVDEAPA
jgi:deoxyribose-phosphate aldolase